MGKLFMAIGKSASGKDTVAQALVKCFPEDLHLVIPYTTRPRRAKEKNGVEYYFVSESKMRAMEKAGKILECRAYETVAGTWYYFTADDGQIDLKNSNCMMVGTPELYRSMVKAVGKRNIVPFLIEVDDEDRLLRAIYRERKQEEPNYREVCRRYLADEVDYAPEIVDSIVTDKAMQFYNYDFDACMDQAKREFRRYLKKGRTLKVRDLRSILREIPAEKPRK